MLQEGSAHIVSAHPADQLVPSRDGRFVLYGQVHGTTPVLELATGQRWEIGRDLLEPSWSPDGGHIAFSGRRGGSGPERLYVANADGTGWTEIFRGDSDSGIASLHRLPEAGPP